MILPKTFILQDDDSDFYGIIYETEYSKNRFRLKILDQACCFLHSNSNQINFINPNVKYNLVYLIPSLKFYEQI